MNFFVLHHNIIQCKTSKSYDLRKFFNTKISTFITVDTLVKKWAPLVWLAPNEKFLPGDVKTFLSNVHAERERKGSQKIKDIGDNLGKYSQYYQNDGFKDLIYYEKALSTTKNSAPQNNRRRRNFDKGTKYELFELFELPIDEASEDW